MKFLDLDRQTLDAAGRASVIGLHMVSAIFVGGAIGWGLDYWLGTFPWLSGIFFVFGIIAGFYNVWLDTKRIIKMQEKNEPKT